MKTLGLVFQCAACTAVLRVACVININFEVCKWSMHESGRGRERAAESALLGVMPDIIPHGAVAITPLQRGPLGCLLRCVNILVFGVILYIVYYKRFDCCSTLQLQTDAFVAHHCLRLMQSRKSCGASQA